jgi:hypothetical protein
VLGRARRALLKIDKSNVLGSQHNDATEQTNGPMAKASSMDYEPWPCAMFFASNETLTNPSSKELLYSVRLSIGQKKAAFN